MKKSLKIINIFIVFILFTQILFSQVRRIGFEENIIQNNQTNQNQESQSDILAKGMEFDILEKAIDPKSYILGAGDILTINIISAKSKYLIVSISPEGVVEIPYIGNTKLAGMSLFDGKREIVSLLEKNILNSKIDVQLKKMREFKINLTGAVINPGLKIVKPVDRIIDIIQNAGGLEKLGKFNKIHIIHSDSTETIIDGYKYVNNGDLNSNPFIHQGDLIFVPKADPFTETITVSGATKIKGIHPLIKGEKLSEFLHKYNTFSSDISTYSASIIRKMKSGTQYYTIDVMGNNPEIEKKDIILKPNDIVELSKKLEIYVQGKVNRPGSYNYVGGYKVIDYIGLAGGNTSQGNVKKAVIIRDSKTIKGLSTTVKRGDIIIVPRAFSDVLIGEFNILGIVSSFASIILIFISIK